MNQIRLRAAVATVSCLLGLSHPGSAAEPTGGQGFSVMTWNLEWFYDEYTGDNFSDLAKQKSTPTREQWNWRRDAIARSIAEVSPTIVALQEVENRRVLWYTARALEREHKLVFQELGIEGSDHFTEQDVGFLFRSPADVLSISRRMQTRAMKRTERYYSLSKHLIGVFQIPVGNGFEQVTILNVHLRAREEAEPLRRRQARLLHLWIADATKRGENVIVLGDFNTEETGDETRADTDMGIACGRETQTRDDDLIDVTLRITRQQRRTHILGKQFDRILVSRALLIDDPRRPDLVFDAVQVRPDLCIRAGQDSQTEHWEQYWDMPAEKRDLSDHFPVIATFKIR